MADRHAIQQLLAEYAWANDHNDLGLLEGLLTEDMTFTVSIAGEVAVGPLAPREAVVGFIGEALGAQTGQRRHYVSNLRVVEEAADAATVTAYLSIFATEDGALETVSTGVYHGDVVAGDDGAWRLRSLSIELDRPF